MSNSWTTYGFTFINNSNIYLYSNLTFIQRSEWEFISIDFSTVLIRNDTSRCGVNSLIFSNYLCWLTKRLRNISVTILLIFTTLEAVRYYCYRNDTWKQNGDAGKLFGLRKHIAGVRYDCENKWILHYHNVPNRNFLFNTVLQSLWCHTSHT